MLDMGYGVLFYGPHNLPDYLFKSTGESVSWGALKRGGSLWSADDNNRYGTARGVANMDVKYSKAGDGTVVTSFGSRST